MKFGLNLEEFKQAYKVGTNKLREDEYLGDDGLPYCKKCKTPRFFSIDNGSWATWGLCECKRAEQEQKEKEEQARKRMEEFNERKKLSLLGERYKNIMFKDATLTKSNSKAYEKCKTYVDKSKEVYSNNIGLYIYGDNSSGKTFLTACMCNELVWKGYRCIYTNFATILTELLGKDVGSSVLLSRLQHFDFVFIDDLGKEFIGREYNPSSAKWAEGKLFEILNTRYNAHKPTIFSSNYSIGELASILGFDKGIVERINEMATRVIKLEGDDFRSKVLKEKSEFAKKLGI